MLHVYHTGVVNSAQGHITYKSSIEHGYRQIGQAMTLVELYGHNQTTSEHMHTNVKKKSYKCTVYTNGNLSVAKGFLPGNQKQLHVCRWNLERQPEQEWRRLNG